MKRNIIKMIAGLLAFVLLLSGLPTQIAHASAGEELMEVICLLYTSPSPRD